MKNLTWPNPEQLFVAQVLIKKVKLKCCGIWGYHLQKVEVSLDRFEFYPHDGAIDIHWCSDEVF